MGEGGPIKLLTPVVYFELMLGSNGSYKWIPPADYNGLVYIVDGYPSVNNEKLKVGEAYRSGQSSPLLFESKDPSRLMVIYGQAHGEPIFQHGTYVD